MPGALPRSGGPDFEDWLLAGEAALQRPAHLLTGNVYAAQDLVQNTLAGLYREWDRVRTVDDVDGHALRALVREFRTAWRRPGRRAEPLLEVAPTRPTPGSTSYDESREAVWDLVCSLPSKQRSVLVLCYYEELDEAEVADLTGLSPAAVTAQGSRALAALEAWLVDHPEITIHRSPGTAGVEELLARTLAEVVATTHHPTTSAATVAARSRALGRARRRTAVLVVATAALLLAGGWTALRTGDDHATAASPTGPHAPAGSLLTLPQGAAPQVAYLDGGAFVTASGQRVTSRAFRTATTAASLGDGVLIAGRTTSQRPFAVISLVSGGSTRRLGCGTPSFAVGSGDAAYWLSVGCRFVGPGRLFHGTAVSSTPKGVIYSAVGSTSRGLVTDGTQVLQQGAGSAGPLLIAPDGSRSRIPRVSEVSAVSPSGGLVVGVDSRGDGVVAETSTGAVQWRVGAGTLGHFSASGRYVVVTKNLGARTAQGVGDVVAIMDATTGHEVASTVLPNLSIVSTAAWEGDDAVLVVVEDRQRDQAIVRVALDGTITRATRVAPPGQGTFRLAATP